MRRGLPIFLCVVAVGFSAAEVAAASRPAALLQAGTLGHLAWSVMATRDSGPEGGRRPCTTISVALKDNSVGTIHESSGCGRPQPKAPRLHVLSIGLGQKERSILAIATSASTHLIVLDFGRRGVRRSRPVLLSRAKSRRAGVMSFRFLVVALSGPFCLHRYIMFDASNRALVDSGRIPCGR